MTTACFMQSYEHCYGHTYGQCGEQAWTRAVCTGRVNAPSRPVPSRTQPARTGQSRHIHRTDRFGLNYRSPSAPRSRASAHTRARGASADGQEQAA